MTTSRETEGLDFPNLRRMVEEAHRFSIEDRTTLLKGLIPFVASEMQPTEFAALIDELRLKGERYYEAKAQPGEGRDARQVPGERDIESRA